MPEDVGIEHWVPREHTAVEIKFRPPHKIKLGDIGCKGIVVQNIFGLPYPTGLLFLIPGANISYYSAFAVEVGRQPRFLPAKLKISVPRSGAQRQVDAINRLCTPLPHLEALSNGSLNRNAGPQRPDQSILRTKSAFRDCAGRYKRSPAVGYRVVRKPDCLHQFHQVASERYPSHTRVPRNRKDIHPRRNSFDINLTEFPRCL
ncbi:hypothetical protein BDV36DRAFT_47245 [Aspergillus pseudocaelatus]|uniref:Uncharacterized protein n=1 Tax=Aspergillus pseudocaelatus TaxID=1825620 RepID=A0ABQ6W6R9_9EURO|nr:hypothetical protein BDV36DRAFT_47245 [Aspergillus pseudocaelatus]